MIYIKNLSTGYNHKKIIKNLSVSFQSGDFCALIGPNGAGKSTLLKAILNYIPTISGEIVIEDKKICDMKRIEIAKKITLIPQSFSLQFDFTVRDLVLMGRYPFLGYAQSYSQNDKNIVDKVLTELQLDNLQNTMFNNLSGGEQQRVIIARSLVQNTKIILMDEAFSHLDINHQIEIMHILFEINRLQNKTIILVSHNLNLVSEYCSRVIMLKDGKLVADGAPKKVINSENFKKLYGMNLQIIKNPITKNPNIVYEKDKMEKNWIFQDLNK
ncbi:MAG: ABC transporter ATP-binding protein [Candidatus Cloacimonadota bacterium]|nr:ABC transporter ATP-binding protein [Candidatus Cloacimonadota bacterium]